MRAFRFTLSLAALVSVALTCGAQKKTYTNVPLLPPTTPQSVEGGMWRTDAAFDSTLHLKNVLVTQGLQAKPSLIMADGTVVPLAPVTLDAAGVATVNITDALKHLPSVAAAHKSEYGMAIVDYTWSWPGAIMASVQNIDETAMLSFHDSLQTDRTDANASKQAGKPQSIEGIWWKPYPSTGMFLFLGNASDTVKQISVEVRAKTGAPLKHTSLTLGPHVSTKLNVFATLDASPAAGSTGSVRVKVNGSDRSLVAIAGLEDLTNGFSETLHLFEAHPEEARDSTVHPLTIATPGVLLGAQRPEMQFPAHTDFVPYLVVHNSADDTRLVGVSASYTTGSVPTTLDLGKVSLRAGSSKLFAFPAALASVVPDHGSIQLAETFTGNEGDIQLESGSVDQSGNYVFEAESHIENATISRTICYWSVFTDTNTMISLWNYTAQQQDLILTLFFRGGKYELPLHLAAGADLDLDIASLIKKRVPDKNGVVLPGNVIEGSAMLANADGPTKEIEVASSTSTFNVRNGTCTNQCGTCNGVTTENVFPANISVSVNAFLQASASITYNTGSTYAVSGPWSTAQGPIASLSSTGLVGGVSPGSTYTALQPLTYPIGLGYICMGNSLNCPNGTYGGSSPTSVSGQTPDNTPVLTGLDPSDWVPGTTQSVTFSGQYFGTNPPSLVFNPSGGISYSVLSSNDSQIVAAVSVASGTPNEAILVSITSNGSSGNGFQAGNSGNSPHSGPVYANVQAPFGAPQVTIIAWVDGSAPDLALGSDMVTLQQINGANSTLVGSLKNFCTAEIAAWTTGVPKDLNSQADRDYANRFLIAHTANKPPPSSLNEQTVQALYDAGDYRLFND